MQDQDWSRSPLVRGFIAIYSIAPLTYHLIANQAISRGVAVVYSVSMVGIVIAFCYGALKGQQHPLAKVVRGVGIMYGLAVLATGILVLGLWLINPGVFRQ